MKKDYVDLEYAIVWIQDSKTANGSLKLPRSSEGVWGPVGSRGQSSWLLPSDTTRADTRRR
jgi:hypothetical protein